LLKSNNIPLAEITESRIHFFTWALALQVAMADRQKLTAATKVNLVSLNPIAFVTCYRVSPHRSELQLTSRTANNKL